VALGHTASSAVNLGGAGLGVQPAAAGIAITNDGQKLVVANYYNDSISVLTKSPGGWTKTSEFDLRPGKISTENAGVPGGEYPLWVVIKCATTASVSSVRDREIVVVNISGSPAVTTRIKVTGQPGKMVLNAAQTTLFAAEDESDSVALIDTGSNKLSHEFDVAAPAGVLTGALAQRKGNNTNSVTLTPDEKHLYVTNGNMNDVAVIDLGGPGTGPVTLSFGNPVAGLIPTAWYPNSVAFNSDGSNVYVINGKVPTGPNPGNCHGGVLTSLPAATCASTNQYDLQLVKAGLQYFPVPSAPDLAFLTQQVALNNHFYRNESPADDATMDFLHKKIQHVIYIIKENRTYDQVLGDLQPGNGDPKLTEFGATVTPNLHNLASNFVTLDSFYDSSEVSMDGWPWSTSARAPDVVEKQTPVNYAGRGFDNIFPDYYRYTEWSRDVDAGGLPDLSLLRLMHDHTGNFSTALNGVNTPELQVADNDYAVGLVVQKIASSQYAGNTLIFVIEDDAQDGGDHVDAHRSIAFVVGPYVKQQAVVSKSYNTVNMIRTIEDILGVDPLNLNDSVALPMTDVFDVNQSKWNYTAALSSLLYTTTLPLPAKSAALRVPKSTHNAAYWARVTKGMDFSKEDLVDPLSFNRILWQGLKGDRIYPGDAGLAVTRALYKKALKDRAAGRVDRDD
jgi:DNA-binding beta-propeller fold protein YncE